MVKIVAIQSIIIFVIDTTHKLSPSDDLADKPFHTGKMRVMHFVMPQCPANYFTWCNQTHVDVGRKYGVKSKNFLVINGIFVGPEILESLLEETI